MQTACPLVKRWPQTAAKLLCFLIEKFINLIRRYFLVRKIRKR